MTTEAERQVKWLEGWVAENRDGDAVYGDHWGKVTDGAMSAVFAHLCDHLTLSPACVLEIGPGGGRWSREIASRIPESSRLILVDGTDAARPVLGRVVGRPFDLLVSADGNIPEIPDSSVDLVFSFDVFVHFDGPLFARYLAEVARVLKPGGRLMLHYAWAWPTFPAVLEDHGACFIPPSDESLAMLWQWFHRDLYGMHFPIPRGFGSLFESLAKR